MSWILIPSRQAKMSISHGGSCKNQTFVLFAIECVCESFLMAFGIDWSGFGSSWAHFEVHLGLFWRHFGVILRLRIVSEALFLLKSISTVQLIPFWMVLEASWGGFAGFWRPLRKVFRYILVSLFDIDFATDFYMLLIWFLMHSDPLQTSKTEHFTWRVMQKSNFRVVWTKLKLDWHQRWIFDWFLVILETFWEGKSIKTGHG